MSLSFEALSVLLVLLPGIVVSQVLSFVTPRPRLAFTETLLEACAFSAVVYTLASPVIYLLTVELSWITQTNGIVLTSHNVSVLVLATGVATALTSAVASLVQYREIPTRLLTKLGMTRRISQYSVWRQAFATRRGYVVVLMQDERRISGWPTYWGDHDGDRYVYLEEVSWILDDDTDSPITGVEGMLLKLDDTVRCVMMMEATSKPTVTNGDKS